MRGTGSAASSDPGEGLLAADSGKTGPNHVSKRDMTLENVTLHCNIITFPQIQCNLTSAAPTGK